MADLSPGRAKSVIFLIVVIDLLGFGIVIPLLPLYAKAISAHPTPWMAWINHFLALKEPGAFWAGLAFASFSIAQFWASPLLGRWSDRVGRRPVLWLSMLGAAMGYLLLGTAQQFIWILVARLIGGVMGGNLSVAQAAMADLSSVQERSKAMGLIGAAFGLGFVLGPFVGGTLASSALGMRLESQYGWQLPFLVSSALSLTASLLTLAWLPETRSLHTPGKSSQAAHPRRGLWIVFKRPGMARLLSIAFAAMTGFAMMEGTFSLLAHERFQLGRKEVGYLFGVTGILIVIYQGLLVRLIAKRFPEKKLLSLGLFLMACFMPLLAHAPWKWPFVLLMVPLAWGSGMNNTASAALASQQTPPEEQGALFGALNAIAGLGRIAGPLLGTIVYAKLGYPSVYYLSAFVIAAGLFLSFGVRTKA